MRNLPAIDRSGTNYRDSFGVIGQNLIPLSEQFNLWSQGGLTGVTANADPSPFGARTADRVIENSATSAHTVAATAHASCVGQQVTVSVFAKAGSRSFIAVFGNAASNGAWFNLGTGAVGTAAGATRVIEAFGGGHYRCSITYTASSAGVNIYLADADASVSYLGNGSGYVSLWGAQMNIGPVARPYVTTDTLARF